MKLLQSHVDTTHAVDTINKATTSEDHLCLEEAVVSLEAVDVFYEKVMSVEATEVMNEEVMTMSRTSR